MSVYNAEPYLEKAVTSVLSQTFRDLELICIDDGSTDNSLAILESLAKKDSRVRVFKNDRNRGIGYTATKLAKLAAGKFLAKIDADDIMLPDRLAKQVFFLKNNPSVVAVGGQCELIDTEGKSVGKKVLPTRPAAVYNQIYALNSMHQPTIMINRSLIPGGELIYDNAVSPVDDYDLFFRLFKFGQLANLEDVVLKYRIYNTSSSMKNLKSTYEAIQKVRVRAVFEYGYRPTSGALIIAALQTLAVALFPSRLLFSMLNFVRGLEIKDIQYFPLASSNLL